MRGTHIIKRKTVREKLLYEYALLISDARVYGRKTLAATDRKGHEYYACVTKTYRRLIEGKINPSDLDRENQLLYDSDKQCAYCGATGPLEWEHIIPIARGGPVSGMDNKVRACGACNRKKSTRNPVEWYGDRKLDRKHIPRLVMGKLWKLVMEEHRRRGTLDETEFPPGQGLRLVGVFSVFDFKEPSGILSTDEAAEL